MLISAEEARALTYKINDEYIEAILERPIREAIEKGHYHCYITFGDMYSLLEATLILKEKGYTYEYSTNNLILEIKWERI